MITDYPIKQMESLNPDIKQFAKEVAQEQWELYNDYYCYKSLEMPELKYQDFSEDAINATIRKRENAKR